MGVVHKFKTEVVEFILQQKRNDRFLSCRQLSVLTTEKFQRRVSKSSINNIIKKASLSSCVGRRPLGEGRPRKFYIPPQKMEQIQENMRKAGVALAKDLTPPQILQQPAVIRKKQLSRSDQRGPLYEGMGLVFLKAAEWELTSTSFLGQLFRPYVNDRSLSDVESACELLLSLHLLGAGGVDDFARFQNYGPWVQMETSALCDWTKTFSPSDGLRIEYSLAKEQIFTQAGSLRLLLKDGTTMLMDPQCVSLWKNRVPAHFSSPINKAMTMLSRFLISNNQSLILHAIPEEERNGVISDLAAAFDGREDKAITHVAVLGLNEDCLAEFSTFPSKKRFFMTGVWPGQKIFDGLSKNVIFGDSRKFYHERLDKLLYFKELSMDSFPPEFRGIDALGSVIVFDADRHEPQAVVLTNDGVRRSEEIVFDFFMRWPNLGEHPVVSSSEEKAFSTHGNEDVFEQLSVIQRSETLSDIFMDFAMALRQYSRKLFFPDSLARGDLTSLFSTICDIPGYCRIEDNCLSVDLRVPSTHPYAAALENAVRKLNEGMITDFQGRRVLVFLEKEA